MVKKKALLSLSNFERSFIDFERGIRVGRLDPSQRITQLLKAMLIERTGCDMICDRWGRGVYWQWICWIPRPNRDAKPLSSGYNFGSAKFFVSVDREDREFLAGMQIERAPARPSSNSYGVSLQKDWDWKIMEKALKGKELPSALRGLLKEGFRLRVGPFESVDEYNYRTFDIRRCLGTLKRFPRNDWGMFQLSYAIPQKEIANMSGGEILEAALSIFDEVSRPMNLCMYQPCLTTALED